MANPGPSVADHLCRGDELRPLGKGPGLDSGAGVGGKRDSGSGEPSAKTRHDGRDQWWDETAQHNVPCPRIAPDLFFERRRRHAVCGHRPS